MENKIYALGFLGNFTCYFNVDLQEAIKRYCEEFDYPLDGILEEDEDDASLLFYYEKGINHKKDGVYFSIKAIYFEDKFTVYDIE